MAPHHTPLTPTFFNRNTLAVARELLGMVLVRRLPGGEKRIAGVITETEAYRGTRDLACHASRGRTKRTEGLYGPPGTLYVYLIYGFYWCANIVTERRDYPAAVLIRAVHPLEGLKTMRCGRSRKKSFTGPDAALANGPGKLCDAFGITGALHGHLLGAKTLTVEDWGFRVPQKAIQRLPRVGVDYAGPAASWPWRFHIDPRVIRSPGKPAVVH